MARAKVEKSVQKPAPSSELGEGDFAITKNARTGRPLRSSTARKTDSPFVDSAVAISDEESSVSSSDESEIISRPARPRKRKRTPSPSPSLSSEPSLVSAPATDDTPLSDTEDEDRALPVAQPLQITLNVPAGPERHVILNLDLGTLVQSAHSSANHSTSSKRLPKRPKTRRAPSLHCQPPPPAIAGSVSGDGAHAGFLDLPAEMRNEIYRLVFVADGRIDFGSPGKRFKRSAALLRTCRQVHEEGRTILYAENQFFFQRRTQRHGSYWDDEWAELGYKTIRKFLKDISAANTGLIKHITMLLEDAVPSLNPQLRTAEERRFVHDDVLHSILRHLGRHGRLEKLHLHFAGRRNIDSRWSNEHFLDLLQEIQADEVQFVKHPIWGQSYNEHYARSKQSEHVKRVCLEAMVRKKKLYALKK